MSPRVRWIGGALASVVAFLVLAGATYQGVATSLERREFRGPTHTASAVLLRETQAKKVQ